MPLFRFFKKRQNPDDEQFKRVDEIYEQIAKCDQDFNESTDSLKTSVDNWYACMVNAIPPKCEECPKCPELPAPVEPAPASAEQTSNEGGVVQRFNKNRRY